MDDPTRADVLKRLAYIEGHLAGIRRMVEQDTYCVDVLTQVAAATKALQSVAVGLLDQHVRHCVAHAEPAAAEVTIAPPATIACAGVMDCVSWPRVSPHGCVTHGTPPCLSCEEICCGAGKRASHDNNDPCSPT